MFQGLWAETEGVGWCCNQLQAWTFWRHRKEARSPHIRSVLPWKGANFVSCNGPGPSQQLVLE